MVLPNLLLRKKPHQNPGGKKMVLISGKGWLLEI
ncbi:hypothetical protein PFTANZ_06101 [Plasmodium falciparum Tanzania (2000708)]|uniref:Uncharacterized protein n=1 Tax=Plasmodium falciparum Tanzania (2000708) TaxID=1036725 RepID=A0A024VXY3_PLAFA|nr:hypothetical protein PFTANZ_06101 [Plasmodium falciparum Tanzania (2000708)]